MASICRDKRYGTYYVRFRFGGRNYQRALKSSSRRHANATVARVEETIALIERGRISVPNNVDAGDFILADGNLTTSVSEAPKTLAELFDAYRDELPEGAKEKSTLKLEAIHEKHLLRHLGARNLVQTMSKADLQGYIKGRLQDEYRGKTVKADTVKKEVATLRMVWNWGFGQGYIPLPPPTKGLVYPKADEKYPFMTYAEIMPVVSRTTDEEEISKLWESLYLTKEEIGEVLDDVDTNARSSYIYPMVVLAGHTGARRSELLRSQREDFDFQAGVVTFREKKRSKVNAITFRRVEMSDLVEDVMRQWLSSAEPGPTFTFSLRMSKRWRDIPVSVDSAHYQLQAALSDTRWSVLRGFHVFRHSFASALASAGTDERIIDLFLGHRTDAMRRRYRHLFPHVRKQAIASVFS